MSDVQVLVERGFLNGLEYAKRGTEITVSEIRARDLESNGLVSRKMADKPKNKMAAKPNNKSKAK
ncbi:hypothetical protein H0A71_06055 [Alcaligenaceae bacterium]|nr:hypothetical protein [Alcaligenaceae bacterium]